MKNALDRLVFQWKSIDQSSLHVLWADLGAGKSHTLRHLQYRCEKELEGRVYSVYALLPRELHSFMDLYRSIVNDLDIEYLSKLLLSAVARFGTIDQTKRELFPAMEDVATVLFGISTADDQAQLLARRWLQGDRLNAGERTRLGVSRIVRTTDDAVSMLRGLVRLVVSSPDHDRMVIMFDEYQRIGQVNMRIGGDVNVGVQTLYDSCPKHLSLVLSFGYGSQALVRQLLSAELLSREDPLQLSLPSLNGQDALDFLGDLFKEFSSDDAPGRFSPFTDQQVELVISHILGIPDGISPRSLNKSLHRAMMEMNFRFHQGGDSSLGDDELIALVEEALRQDKADVSSQGS